MVSFEHLSGASRREDRYGQDTGGSGRKGAKHRLPQSRREHAYFREPLACGRPGASAYAQIRCGSLGETATPMLCSTRGLQWPAVASAWHQTTKMSNYLLRSVKGKKHLKPVADYVRILN